MTLNPGLNNEILSHPCGRCGEFIQRPGRWFSTIRQYRCESCGYQSRMSYEAKIQLFNAHAKKKA